MHVVIHYVYGYNDILPSIPCSNARASVTQHIEAFSQNPDSNPSWTWSTIHHSLKLLQNFGSRFCCMLASYPRCCQGTRLVVYITTNDPFSITMHRLL